MFLDLPLGTSCLLPHPFPQFPWGLPQPRFASRTFQFSLSIFHQPLLTLNLSFFPHLCPIGALFYLPQFGAHLSSKIPHFGKTGFSHTYATVVYFFYFPHFGVHLYSKYATLWHTNSTLCCTNVAICVIWHTFCHFHYPMLSLFLFYLFLP